MFQTGFNIKWTLRIEWIYWIRMVNTKDLMWIRMSAVWMFSNKHRCYVEHLKASKHEVKASWSLSNEMFVTPTNSFPLLCTIVFLQSILFRSMSAMLSSCDLLFWAASHPFILSCWCSKILMKMVRISAIVRVAPGTLIYSYYCVKQMASSPSVTIAVCQHNSNF